MDTSEIFVGLNHINYFLFQIFTTWPGKESWVDIPCGQAGKVVDSWRESVCIKWGFFGCCLPQRHICKIDSWRYLTGGLVGSLVGTSAEEIRDLHPLQRQVDD